MRSHVVEFKSHQGNDNTIMNKYDNSRKITSQDTSLSSIKASSSLDIDDSFIKEKGCQQPLGEGIEGYDGLAVIEKVQKGIIESVAEHKALNDTENKSMKILCMVYTYEQRHFALKAIHNTWAPKCDGFFGASNLTDTIIGAIDLPHKGPEEYGNLWQKVRSMWKYAYDNYLDDYDYFHICGDDTYLIVDNLRAYLRSSQVQSLLDGYHDAITRRQRHKWDADAQQQQQQRPLLLGMPFDRINEPGRSFEVYPGGGSGYTLNKAALQIFGEKGYHAFHTDAQDSREDVFIGGLFYDYAVHTSDTRDDYGAQRYHSTDAPWIAQFDGTSAPWSAAGLRQKFLIESLPGLDGVSTQSVSFHLKYVDNTRAGGNMNMHDSNLFATSPTDSRMYRYHALLFGLCGS